MINQESKPGTKDVPEDPFARPEFPAPPPTPLPLPPLHTHSQATNPSRALPGVTAEHTPCADSGGSRRRHTAEAPCGRVCSLLEVEGAFQSGYAQPLFVSRRLTPLLVGRWG